LGSRAVVWVLAADLERAKDVLDFGGEGAEEDD